MKVINYNYGYSVFFDCTIHGKIVITEEEFKKMKRYLLATKRIEYKIMLAGDLERRLVFKKGFYINVRTTATTLIANKYNLAKYKRGNYVFCIITS